MNLLDIHEEFDGPDSEAYTVALVDDPVEGATLLVIMFESEGHTVVFDFDALIERENIEPLDPVIGARIEAVLRHKLERD